MELMVVKMEIPEGSNLVLGQSHFIKTAEDLYEAMAGTVPGAKFGIAFSEASGECPCEPRAMIGSWSRQQGETRFSSPAAIALCCL